VGWVTDAIEKEKMKQQRLQAVIEHLESEVTNLAGETVKHMKESMIHVSRGSLEVTRHVSRGSLEVTRYM